MAGGARTVRSFCRVCTSVCGILVDIDGDEVIRVRGDRDHPLSHGYTCPKGRALPQMHHHPDRFERPLIRTGGALQPTTWPACLDDLGAKLRDIVDRQGPEAVGILFGTGVGMDAAGYRMAQGLQAAIGTPAKFSPLTIDGTAKVLISELMGGSSALTGRPDYDNATFVMLIGSNPVVSHGHTVGMPNPTGAIRDLAKRAQVWVVDPRRTETARLATRHLAPRPGTDYAVLAFLVRELLRSPVDVVTQGVDGLAAAVEPFTLSHAAALADVSAAELSELLTAVRRAGRIAIDTGTGVTMSASANVTQWLSWALLILTDSMNRPGGYWFHPGFAYQLEAFELPISPPEGSFGPGPRSRPETQAFLREWPCAVLPDEIMAGNIRAFLNLGGSLVTAFPDAGSLVPALRRLDVFATTEILPNETTALSTHVLPTKDQLERPDVTLWDILSPRVCAQHTRAVVDAVGERRSMWWVLAELGRRLGHELADTTLSDDTMLASLSGGGRCSFEELAATGYAEAPRELPAPWVERHVERLGGWRLAPP
ncbi:MAG TPA: molybdopterin-dependent oxidoreductase, partial [Mycobacterium sp.]|nr:molybdopterin-dependent oxidoreductase [Mycobacterium sp.]